MSRPAPRRLPFAHRLAALAILLALAVRIVLPALHVHGAGAGPNPLADASATELPCSCGHHHGAPAPGPRDDAPTGERIDAAAGGSVCLCLACELEHGTPGAPPPAAGATLPAGTVGATPSTGQPSPPPPATAHGYVSRAPPHATGRCSVPG